MLANKRVHLIIHGIVQGVNFRYSTQQKAIELDVKGWVRNRKDGNVEVIAEGKSDIIDEFINWCKSGPKRASVTKVEIEEVSITTNLTEFEILY
jgi:acylphosphatase